MEDTERRAQLGPPRHRAGDLGSRGGLEPHAQPGREGHHRHHRVEILVGAHGRPASPPPCVAVHDPGRHASRSFAHVAGGLLASRGATSTGPDTQHGRTAADAPRCGDDRGSPAGPTSVDGGDGRRGRGDQADPLPPLRRPPGAGERRSANDSSPTSTTPSVRRCRPSAAPATVRCCGRRSTPTSRWSSRRRSCTGSSCSRTPAPATRRRRRSSPRSPTVSPRLIDAALRTADRDPTPAELWAVGIVGMVHTAGNWWAERRTTMSRATVVDALTTPDLGRPRRDDRRSPRPPRRRGVGVSRRARRGSWRPAERARDRLTRPPPWPSWPT